MSVKDTVHTSATGTSADIQVVAAAASHFSVVAPSSATAGIPFSVTLTARDPFGNIATGYTGTLQFTSTDGGGSTALPANYTLVAADNGVHTFTGGVTLTTAGIQTVSVQDTVDTSATGTSGNIAVSAAGLDHFTVGAPPAVTAGVPFGVTVTARDQFGNTATGYGGTVHFTKTDSGSGSPVPANYTFVAGDDGVHTFTDGVTLTTAGLQTVSVQDTVETSATGTSGNIAVAAGAATQLVVTAPATAVTTVPFGVTLTATDQFGNTATGYGGTVHFTKTDSGVGSSVPADYTFVAGDDGVHTFGNGVTFVSVGTQTVTATDAVASGITGTSGPILVSSNDTTAPTATITFPASGPYNASGWSAGCAAPGLCGNAADSTGVQSVKLSILQQSTGKYWDGTAFSLSAETFVASTLGSPGATSTSWSFPLAAVKLTDGGYVVHVQTADTVGNSQTSTTYAATDSFTYDATAPTVVVSQAAGQVDPTNTLPIHFTAVFDEPVGSFTGSGVTLTGTAGHGSATVTVTQTNPTTYALAVAGLSSDGTVSATVKAGATTDAAGNANALSTSGADNTVTYDTTPPAVAINQAAGQADPTNTGPIGFTAVFSEPINPASFTGADVSVTGTAGGAKSVAVTQIAPNDGTTFTVAVSGMTTDGTVIASILAGGVSDLAGNTNTASTSTDHTVTWDTTKPTVEIDQAAGQADPTNTGPIGFTAVFSEPINPASFTGADVSVTGTAGGTKSVTLTQIAPNDGTTFTVAVSGMTTDVDRDRLDSRRRRDRPCGEHQHGVDLDRPHRHLGHDEAGCDHQSGCCPGRSDESEPDRLHGRVQRADQPGVLHGS